MTYKVLLINSKFPVSQFQQIGEFTFYHTTLQKLPTLHDFHVIVFDVKNLFLNEFWKDTVIIKPDDIRASLFEQIMSGGVVLCFCDILESKSFDKLVSEYHDIQKPPINDSLVKSRTPMEYSKLYNDFFYPIYLDIKNESGDTFNYVQENLTLYKPLFRKIPTPKVSWKCYFGRTDKTIKPLGVTRADYPVFIEISLGKGKLVVIPPFERKTDVFNLFFEEILPQMIKEEDLEQLELKWLAEMQFPLEIALKQKLSQFRSAKNLLSTNGKPLEKAVMNSLELIGFKVEKLQQGAHADIKISICDKEAIVEVKGHKNRQANRNEFNQLLGHLTEIESNSKGILIINHEFEKPPADRNESAFTSDVISVAKKGDFALISCVDLFDLTIKIIESKIPDDQLAVIRQKILEGSGPFHLL
jgi:hypothetical protein